MNFSPDELHRYSRQITLPTFGYEAQKKLKAGKVLIVGAGGLGCPAALYLASAGVGWLGLCEFDSVDLSNLQRQILYEESHVGLDKLTAAGEQLRKRNSLVHLELHHTMLNEQSAEGLVSQYDVIIDGSDNFETRYLLNEIAVELDKPIVSAAVSRFEGQLSVFQASKGPCYRCAFPSVPPGVLNCAEAGVLGFVPGVFGCLQANEAVKLITGVGEPLIGQMLMGDLMRNEWNTVKVYKDPECGDCGAGPKASLQPSACSATLPEISAKELAARLEGKDKPFVLDIRQEYELRIAKLKNDLHIPMEELAFRLDEIPMDRDVVVYCLSGVRSANVVMYLRELGFGRTFNLTGGIRAWSDEVDPTLRKY